MPVVTAWLAPTPAPGEDDVYINGALEGQSTPSGRGERVPEAEQRVVQPEEALPRLSEDTHLEKPRPEAEAVLRPAQKPGSPPPEGHQPPAPQADQKLRDQEPEETKAKALRTTALSTTAEGAVPAEDRIWRRLQTIFKRHEEKRREEEAHEGNETIGPAPEQPPDSQPNKAMEPSGTSAEISTSGQAAAEDDDKRLRREQRDTSQYIESNGAGSETGLQRQAAELPAQAAPGESGIAATESTSGKLPKVTAIPPEAEGLESTEAMAMSTSSTSAMSTPSTSGDGNSDEYIGDEYIGDKYIEYTGDKNIGQISQKPPETTLEPSSTLMATPPEAGETEAAADGTAAKNLTGQKTFVAVPPETDQATAMSTSAMSTSAIDTSSTSQALQPLPLEDAWPVQRQTTQRVRPESQDILPEEGTHEMLSPEKHSQVRDALQEVSPGKPTDSPVEMITPRRPRPATAPVQEKEEEAIPSQPPIHSSSELVNEESDMASAKPAKEPEMVDTEIGQLPMDLWELIGESPRTAPTKAKQTAAPSASGEPVVGESPVSQKGEIMREVSPELVQRQASPQQAVEPTSAGAANPPAETRGTSVDMDELAVRVYGEVKKRLAVEWERLRRRF